MQGRYPPCCRRAPSGYLTLLSTVPRDRNQIPRPMLWSPALREVSVPPEARASDPLPREAAFYGVWNQIFYTILKEPLGIQTFHTDTDHPTHILTFICSHTCIDSHMYRLTHIHICSHSVSHTDTLTIHTLILTNSHTYTHVHGHKYTLTYQ